MTTENKEASFQAQAEAITNKYVGWATGAGLIPIPLADLAAITAVQVKMLREITTVYQKDFMENRCKRIVVSLIGGLGATTAAASVAASFAKIIPGVGSLLGIATLPVLSGAITYAIGKVFIQHFESGGTFLTFDAAAVRQAFVQEFNDGKQRLIKVGDKVEAKLDCVSDTLEAKLRPSA